MSQHLLAKSRYKLSYWLLALGLAAFQGFFLWRAQGMPLWPSFAFAGVLWLGGAALLYGFVQTTAYYFPKERPLVFGLGATVLLSGLLWLLRWLYLEALGQWGVEQEALLGWIASTEISQLALIFSLMAAGVSLAILWYRLEEKAELLNRRFEMEQLSREAELYKLRQQLQPHFLFNSLNSINALIGNRPKEAREMTQKLADFFRGTLDFGDAKRISFEEEWEQLQRYLSIETVRFGHRLKIESDIAEAALKAKLPPLISQPLLENAIKHGLYGTTEQTELHLRAWREKNLLKLELANPYDTQPRDGLGFGLRSVQRRLYLLYGRTDLLRVERAQDWFIVTLNIPQDHV